MFVSEYFGLGNEFDKKEIFDCILLWNKIFRVAKKAQTSPSKLKKVNFELSWQVARQLSGPPNQVLLTF